MTVFHKTILLCICESYKGKICCILEKVKPVSSCGNEKHRSFVGREGVEPSRCYQRQILSLLRLPIPPSPRRICILPYFEILSSLDALSLLDVYLAYQSLIMKGK